MQILLAYVPSATSEAAFEFAVDDARARGATLLVLASETGLDARKGDSVADKRPLTERLDETGVEYRLQVVPRRDDPADDILRAAESGEVDLVVLGIRKRTPIGKILLGSTSQRVIMEAPCPVVCVKPKSFVPPRI
ncbi:universal stress protein [Brachybacterium nesterenkovii]|uniref:universal stress protein n=1 Tax=Brachybacterium nesterenkovii TaxID=47847 RepID=UPI003218FB44